MNKDRERLIKLGLEDEYEQWKRDRFGSFEEVDSVLSGIYSKKGSRRSKQYTTYNEKPYKCSPQYYQPEHFVRAGTYKHRILQRLSAEKGCEAKRSTILGKYPHGLDPQDAGMYLRRMEYADIVERPKRGVYRLTPKGKKVFREVEEYSFWGRNKGWSKERLHREHII